MESLSEEIHSLSSKLDNLALRVNEIEETLENKYYNKKFINNALNKVKSSLQGITDDNKKKIKKLQKDIEETKKPEAANEKKNSEEVQLKCEHQDLHEKHYDDLKSLLGITEEINTKLQTVENVNNIQIKKIKSKLQKNRETIQQLASATSKQGTKMNELQKIISSDKQISEIEELLENLKSEHQSVTLSLELNQKKLKKVAKKTDMLSSLWDIRGKQIQSDIKKSEQKMQKVVDNLKMTLEDRMYKQTPNNDNVNKQICSVELNNIETTDKLFKLKKAMFWHWNELDEHPVDFTNEFLELQCLAYTWKLGEVGNRFQRTTFRCESKIFVLNGYHFGAKVMLHLKPNGLIYMALCFKDYLCTNQPIKVAPNPMVTYILKSKNQERNRTFKAVPLFKSKLRYDTFCYEQEIVHKSVVLNSEYSTDNVVQFQILVEPPSIAQQLFSCNGVVTFKIDEYFKKKKFAEEELVFGFSGPYFYTSQGGYRVLVNVWLDGYGDYEKKGLSIQITFTAGEFDDVLHDSFVHKTTATIFNQKKLTEHLVKSEEQDMMKNPFYFIDIASHHDIEKLGFIKNDSLILKVEIEQIIDKK